MVPFSVTFDPSLAGTTQTITATVDPGNALDETNFTNNTSSVQVNLQAQYKLIGYVNGKLITGSGQSSILPPSVNGCGAIPSSSQTAELQIQCVDASDITRKVPGCSFLMELGIGANNGGHDHNQTDGSRPFTLNSPDPGFPINAYLDVDARGADLTYTPPEVSGDVYLTVTGMYQGKIISGFAYTFEVKSGTAMQPLSVAGGFDNSGVTSHPTGIYVTSKMNAKIQNMVNYYGNFAQKAGLPVLQIVDTSATLPWGGLFDYNYAGQNKSTPAPWVPPHCGHRDGQTIDIAMTSSFLNNGRQRKLLNQAVSAAGLTPTNPAESIKAPAATHWHLHLLISA